MKSALRRCLILLLLIGAPACVPAGMSDSGDVRVTLAEFTITASRSTFETSVPYHLVITNRGQVNHELRIVPPGDGAETPAALSTRSLFAVDEMGLPPGATRLLELSFPEAGPPGSLEFACHLPSHYEFGMHTDLTVR